MAWKVPEQYRLKDARGRMFSMEGEPYGAFRLPSPDKSRVTKAFLEIIASPGMEGVEWEHVSVRVVKHFGKQTKNYTPTWDEMCFVKSLFWDDEDRVMQLHPERSQYVNDHPNVLHLWRPHSVEIPLPPRIAV